MYSTCSLVDCVVLAHLYLVRVQCSIHGLGTFRIKSSPNVRPRIFSQFFLIQAMPKVNQLKYFHSLHVYLKTIILIVFLTYFIILFKSFFFRIEKENN